MLRLTHSIRQTENLKLAFSGGVDSLSAAHFFRRRKDLTLYHFNHGCEYSDQIAEECIEKAKELELPIVIGRLRGKKKNAQSLEDFWRRARYRFLYEAFGSDVITAHHLDDALETWVWSSLHGDGKIIDPLQTIHTPINVTPQKLHRPFLLTPKRELVEYAERHGLVPVADPYNNEMGLTRNYIRANMMEHVLVVNPGIEKVIRKKYLTLLKEMNHGSSISPT